MVWRKSSPELLAAFAAAFPADPRAERKMMFGCPCGFVQGQMFAGLQEQNLVVRLPPPARTELLAEPGAEAFMPQGRAMREYIVVPAAWHHQPTRLALWLRRAFDYAASLPPKTGRQRGGQGRRKRHAKATRTLAAPGGASGQSRAGV
jgi:TfoX/Sxy family transcriptional regulator of competence genes